MNPLRIRPARFAPLGGSLAFAAVIFAAAPASAVLDVAGATTARFDWTAAAGPVASYAVYVNRNSTGFPSQPEQVVSGTSVTLQGALNQTLVVRVHAKDAQGNLGPASPDSEVVRFVSGAALALSATSAAVTVTQGQNAASQSFTVRNTGGGTLSYTIADDAAWLSASPASGTSTGESDTITVSFTTTGLAPGTHTGKITVSATGASGAPATFTVNLTVLQALGAPGKPTLAQVP